MTQTAEFWDNLAVKYAALPIKDPDAYQYTLDRTRSYLSKKDRVLEIGCGTGSTALLLAGNVAEITGTDISPEMMRIAQEKADAEGSENVRFQVRSALQSAQDAKGMDAVLGFNILHLTQDVEGILKALHRELEPGALLITKTPCLAEPSIGFKRHIIRFLVPLMQLVGKAPYVRHLSFHELEGMISWAGFKIIEVGSYPAMSRYIVARRL